MTESISFDLKTRSKTTDDFRVSFKGNISVENAKKESIINTLNEFLNSYVEQHTLEEALTLINQDSLESSSEELRSNFQNENSILQLFNIKTVDAYHEIEDTSSHYQINPDLESGNKKKGFFGRLFKRN